MTGGASSPPALVHPYAVDRWGQRCPFLRGGDVILEAATPAAWRALEQLQAGLAERYPTVYGSELACRLPSLPRIIDDLAGPRRRLRLARSHVLELDELTASRSAPVVLALLLEEHDAFVRQQFGDGDIAAFFRGTTAAELFGEPGSVARGTTHEERFREFLLEIGLGDLCTPVAVAGRVVEALRHQFGSRYPGALYDGLLDFLHDNPGRNLERWEFDELWSRLPSPPEVPKEVALGEINATLRVVYAPLQHEIDRAHEMFHVPLTLVTSGLEAFCEERPVGLASPGQGSLFRVAPCIGGAPGDPFPVFYLCLRLGPHRLLFPLGEAPHFPAFAPGQGWSVTEHYITVTAQQLGAVEEQALRAAGRTAEPPVTAAEILSASAEAPLQDDPARRQRATRKITALEELRQLYERQVEES
jgi:hypothetical protein